MNGYHTKLSVYGWIRNKGKSLRLRNIPSMINAICILYFRDDEIFDIICKKSIRLSENKKIITSIGRSANNNYGITKIVSANNLIYQWDLRIVKCEKMSDLIFGITSNQKAITFDDGVHYAFRSCGTKSTNNQRFESYTNEVGTGDTVSIHLDLNKAQIKLSINGKEQGIAFENIKKSKDIVYRLFVSVSHKDIIVEILHFSKRLPIV